MVNFNPALPYTTPILLLIPTYTTEKGVSVKTYDESNGIQIFCSWKTYGGTETTQNDLYTVLDTAQIETWFRPEIKSDCRIKDLETKAVYEILGKPEDINRRHQILKFKVQAVEGGA
jgi:hypothetical protein